MDQREKEYLNILTKRFEENSYIDFVKDLLNLSQFDISNTLDERKDIDFLMIKLQQMPELHKETLLLLFYLNMI